MNIKNQKQTTTKISLDQIFKIWPAGLCFFSIGLFGEHLAFSHISGVWNSNPHPTND